MEVAKVTASRIIPRTRRRRRLALLQLFIVVGLLALVWFSFGRNVLTPPKQPGVPEQLGTLELIGSIEGSEALVQINRLHGIDIEMVSAYIAEYARGSQRVTVWVSRTESSNAAAELINRMLQAIEKGDSVFSNLQRLIIADHQVFRIDGPGGEHFFYNSKKLRQEIVWLTVEASDALGILKQALKTF